jgi:hypothetical protein
MLLHRHHNHSPTNSCSGLVIDSDSDPDANPDSGPESDSHSDPDTDLDALSDAEIEPDMYSRRYCVCTSSASIPKFMVFGS